MPPEVLMSIPVYAADVQSNRGPARALMEKLAMVRRNGWR